MGVVRGVKSDSKQQVRMNLVMRLISMNFDMKLIFLHVVRYTKINLFDSVHSDGCSQAHLGIPKLIINIKFAISQDWIELWCSFLHIDRLWQKQSLAGGFQNFTGEDLKFSVCRSLSWSWMVSSCKNVQHWHIIFFPKKDGLEKLTHVNDLFNDKFLCLF